MQLVELVKVEHMSSGCWVVKVVDTGEVVARESSEGDARSRADIASAKLALDRGLAVERVLFWDASALADLDEEEIQVGS